MSLYTQREKLERTCQMCLTTMIEVFSFSDTVNKNIIREKSLQFKTAQENKKKTLIFR